MKIAIFDIDGVLANDTHRVDHALNKRWTQYFDKRALAADTVWEQGRDVMKLHLDYGWTIAYMTGRRDDLRLVTEDWLDANGFPVGRLIMRPMLDKRRLAIIKAERMEHIMAQGIWDDVVLFDDDPEVIRQVGARVGYRHAHHCTWHIKQTALVRTATA